MVDILLKMREDKPIITEILLILRYDKEAGASKMNVGRGTAGMLVQMKRAMALYCSFCSHGAN